MQLPLPRLRIALASLAGLGLSLALGPATAVIAADAPPVSRQDYKAWLDVALSRLYPEFGKPTAISGYAGDVGIIACYLHEGTGEAHYLDLAVKIARTAIAKWDAGKGQSGRGYNFPDAYSRAYTYRYAALKGGLAEAEKSTLRAIMEDLSTHAFYEGGGAMNRILGLTLCIPPALAMVPDHPKRAELSQLLELQVDELKHTREPLENSTNYDSMTAYYMLAFIEENKLEQLYADPKMKEAFEKVLFNLSPKGTIPWFGDYGGIERAAPGMIAFMEKAAAVTRDGRFKWAAHRLFRAEYARIDPHLGRSYNGYELMGLAGAYRWADDQVPEVEPSIVSAVTRRTSGAPDKATFRSGWGERDLFMMVDLLNGCEHGDDDALAVISVSKDGANCLHDSGGRSQSNHSAPLESEFASDFPVRDFAPKPGWQHAAFQLDQNWSWGTFQGVSRYQDAARVPILPSSYRYDPARQFAFALLGYDSFHGQGRIYVDDIRLIDGQGRATVLENFVSDAPGWRGTHFQRVEGGKVDAHCGMAEFKSGQPEPFIGKVFDLPLDVHAGPYQRIEFWYKIESAGAGLNTRTLMATIGDRWMYPRNYPFFLNPMYPTSIRAFHEGAAGAYGDFSIDETDASGRAITREREVLFARAGFAWVRDTFQLRDAGDYVCGPVWHVVGASRIQGNAFDAKGVEPMLIYGILRNHQTLMQAPDRIETERPQSAEPNRFVVYQEWKGRGPRSEVSFDTLLRPHSPQADPAELANAIRIAYDRDGATLLQVESTLVLLNRSGAKVNAEGLETDCRSLCLSLENGAVRSASGTGGTFIRYKGRTVRETAPLSGSIP